MSIKPTAFVEQRSEIADCIDKLADESTFSRPVSTYRLQFNRDFRFEDATRLVKYLHTLGVSHAYASPILKARAGSTHGYDIIDHNQLNPEVGTEQELRNFVSALKSAGMGLILDTVPNHMGIGHGTNPWWQDVLQNGRTSVYADYFDIEWEPIKPELRGKVLIPILGSQYGEELEAGNIKLEFANGQFRITYFDNDLPIDPQTVPMIFEPLGSMETRAASSNNDVRAFIQLLGKLKLLPENSVSDPERIVRRRQDIGPLMDRLRQLSNDSSEVRSLIERSVTAINGKPGNSHSFDSLHRLLEEQVYRLAFWRVSGEEINYRRFFDINDLVGIRMENPEVFAATHKLIRKLLGEELISGLRIDHPDGLLNPAQYFLRLQMLYAASQCCGPEPQGRVAENGIEPEALAAFAQYAWTSDAAPLFTVVEKILEPGEELPTEWPVDGTVGYEFGNALNGILIDHRNERHFTNLYHRVIGGNVDVEELVYNSKKTIMDHALSSEVNVLTHILDEISSRDRRARDFTRSVLRRAIRETIAYFPVYRTYIDERGNVKEWDRRYIQQAIDRAKRRSGYISPAVFDFLRSILLLEGPPDDTFIFGYRRQLYFSLKFQQLTGPVTAKGLEDTACYVYNRFVSVNDVGGSPADFGVPVGEFHRGNQIRVQQWPHAMLSTSTHDSKRSEDVRARLNVLSEMPRTWATEVMKWRRINRARKVELSDGRTVPDNNEEYLLYQTIVGAWPMKMEGEHGRQEFIRRIQQYMEKAVHEGKVNLSWINPNPDYISALNDFVATILEPQYRRQTNLYFSTLQRFLPPVIFFGAINSLTQTLLKLMSPGVPDIYQGQEMFDFSLVDPDNRRPVDFSRRMRALDDLAREGSEGNDPDFCRRLLQNYRDGRVKLWVTWKALNCRHGDSELFQYGRYAPVQVVGGKHDHVVAFARAQDDRMAVVAAPRLSYTLMKGVEHPPLGHVWLDTQLVLPDGAADRQFRNVFTQEIFTPRDDNSILCRELFAHFPVALLTAA